MHKDSLRAGVEDEVCQIHVAINSKVLAYSTKINY